MPCADDLEEEVRALWAKGEITEFVTHEEGRGLIIVELFQERAIGLCGDEMIDHVDGSGEEDLDIGITGCIGDRFSEEGFSGTWVTDEDNIFKLFDKVEVKKVEDVSFLILS